MNKIKILALSAINWLQTPKTYPNPATLPVYLCLHMLHTLTADITDQKSKSGAFATHMEDQNLPGQS